MAQQLLLQVIVQGDKEMLQETNEIAWQWSASNPICKLCQYKSILKIQALVSWDPGSFWNQRGHMAQAN